MKRFLFACTLALSVMAIAEQKASAWSKFNFNVGLNLSREASDNSAFFGLIRNGPAPYAQGAQGGGYEGGGYGGGQGGGQGGGVHQYYNPMPTTAMPAQSVPAQSALTSSTQQIGYYNYNYQYYPTTGYYAAPSYWYGN